MQINGYNLDNVNSVFNEKNSNMKNVQALQKTGFFGVALEKAGMNGLYQNGYMNYDRTGQESGQSQGQNAVLETKEDVLAYINDNIEKLQSLVTAEDYSAMSELGLAPDKENPDVLLTVYERIQIGLAAYCDGYDGGSLNISSEKMEAVLGSQAMANAVKMAEETGELSDASKSYLLRNSLEPTIGNVYKAVHSTSTGSDTVSEPLSDAEWADLKAQVSELLDKSGIEVNNENLNNAKWLVEHSIPATSENILKVSELNHADMSNMEVIKSNIAFALMMGMDGTEAFVTESWINTEKIEETIDAVSGVSDETIYDIVNDNAVLNPANIRRYQAKGETGDRENRQQGEEQNQRDYGNPAFLKARSVIIEARLVMTSSSLLNMQKVGINITYTEISVMITQAERDDKEYYSAFFEEEENQTAENTAIVSSLMDMMKSMSQVPSVVLGEIYSEKIEFTLESVYEESGRISADFSKAELTYEAVGTQVRRDLGDNINKAFESIDGILEDLDIEINETSRRAARILGYNQMEINKESVLQMESLMEQLDYVRDNLTPKTAVCLVENHVNILNTDIRELNRHLVELNGMIGADENENFAEYLWKLEKKGEISKTDRDRYIELYRTLHMVESMDARSIGAVTAEGAEFTLNNLLSAVKSRNKSGMDIAVDETFGLTVERTETMEMPSENIAEFVRRMAVKIKSGLNAENVEKVYKNGSYGEISLGNLLDVVSDNESVRANEQLHAEYVKQVMDYYLKEVSEEGITEDTVLTLMEGGHRATMENILSAIELSTPGSDFRKYLMDKRNRREIAEAAENILENFVDKESAAQGMETLKEMASAEARNESAIDISYEKIKAMADINRNLRFMVRSAENESYNIPADIGGEAVNIRVSFVHEEGEGKVNISMNTISFGRIDSVIRSVNMVSGVKSEAVVYCERTETAGIITGSKSIFVHEIKEMDSASEFSMEISGNRVNMQDDLRKGSRYGHLSADSSEERVKVETGYLYRISKSFIKSVKDCLEKNR